MSPIWIGSMVLLWIVVALLCALVLSLLRQVGRLSMKVAAIREETEQPALYTRMPAHELRLASGENFTVGGQKSKPTLIVFFSPSCSVCEALPPAVAKITAERGRDIDILAVPSLESSDDATVKEYITRTGLQNVLLTPKSNFPEHMFPSHGVPFAIALAADGTVAARGKPKALSHLQEMAHAAMHMAEIATTTAFRDHEWGQSVPYWQLGSGTGDSPVSSLS